MQKIKAVVGAGIIGIGAILLLAGLLNKVGHENCIVEGRASFEEFYDSRHAPRTGTPICPPDNSIFLYVMGSVAKAAGVVVLIAGLTDASLLSLSRKN